MAAPKRAALATLRRRIDVIDARIVRLLEQRTALAVRTARLKKRLGVRMRQPEREADVMRRVIARAKLFPSTALKSIYRTVMNAALAMEKRQAGR